MAPRGRVRLGFRRRRERVFRRPWCSWGSSARGARRDTALDAPYPGLCDFRSLFPSPDPPHVLRADNACREAPPCGIDARARAGCDLRPGRPSSNLVNQPPSPKIRSLRSRDRRNTYVIVAAQGGFRARLSGCRSEPVRAAREVACGLGRRHGRRRAARGRSHRWDPICFLCVRLTCDNAHGFPPTHRAVVCIGVLW